MKEHPSVSTGRESKLSGEVYVSLEAVVVTE